MIFIVAIVFCNCIFRCFVLVSIIYWLREFVLLTHFSPMSHVYTLWKPQKTYAKLSILDICEGVGGRVLDTPLPSIHRKRYFSWVIKGKSSHWRCSVKKVVLKSFTNFTGKHFHWSLSLINLHLQHRCFPVKFLQRLWWPILCKFV